MATRSAEGCGGLCRQGLGFEIAMAFQPIVDIAAHEIWAYEALVRGPNGEGAGTIFAQVTDQNRYAFDQACRVTAIETAAELGLTGRLSINFLPNAVYRPETCIRATLDASDRVGFAVDKLVFEVTEAEKVEDRAHLKNIFTEYKKHQFLTAIDDFGAGYSGLNLLAEWQPDIIKLDMNLIRDIDQNKTKQLIVKSILDVCHGLGIQVISEGVETRQELEVLVDFGVNLFQGYYFAKPLFEGLPAVPETCFKLN